MVQEHLIELSVGESIQVGEYFVRILDVNGDELCIEIDGDDQGGLGVDSLSGVLETV
ncbi:hypothetical protein [Planctomicrobium sp. SH664]|uniref:hypothetical protein n=1 Tax=Planctomicrobium sp. SH664 TaxID=3448125 RepID=UPI003F5BECEA